MKALQINNRRQWIRRKKSNKMNFLPRCKCIHTQKNPPFKNAANCCGLNCSEAVCIGNRESCLGCLSCLTGFPWGNPPYQVSSLCIPAKPCSNAWCTWGPLSVGLSSGKTSRQEAVAQCRSSSAAQRSSPELQPAHAVLQPQGTAESQKIYLKTVKKKKKKHPYLDWKQVCFNMLCHFFADIKQNMFYLQEEPAGGGAQPCCEP